MAGILVVHSHVDELGGGCGSMGHWFFSRCLLDPLKRVPRLSEVAFSVRCLSSHHHAVNWFITWGHFLDQILVRLVTALTLLWNWCYWFGIVVHLFNQDLRRVVHVLEQFYFQPDAVFSSAIYRELFVGAWMRELKSVLLITDVAFFYSLKWIKDYDWFFLDSCCIDLFDV